MAMQEIAAVGRSNRNRNNTNVGGRNRNEIRRPEQIRLQDNSVGDKAGSQFFQCRLYSLGHLDGVGGVLFRYVEDHAGFALDAGAPDRRLGSFNHISHIAQCDARCAMAEQNRTTNVIRRERLALSLEYDALVRRVDKTGATHAGRSPSRAYNVLERQAEPDQLVGMDLNLDRTLVGAKHRHAGDPGDRKQA